MNIPAFFTPLYREMFMMRTDGELKNEVSLISTLLALKGGERILDVGCGAGDMTHAFAENGYDVTGVDVSPDYISTAKQTYPEGDFRLADYGEFEFPDGYDASFCWRTSFGFGRREDDLLLFHKLRGALRSGGRALFDLPNAVHVLMNFEKVRRYETVYRDQPAIVTRVSQIDASQLQLHQAWEFCCSGERHIMNSSLNLYHAAHIRDLLTFAGFTTVDAYGWSGQPLTPDDIRMVIVAHV